MLKFMEIENFRSFEKTQMRNLSKINLITGLNGSGKTSILEALFLISGAANASLAATVNGLRGGINYSQSVDIPFRTMFRNLDAQIHPKIVASSSLSMPNNKKYKRELVIKPKYTIGKSAISTEQKKLLSGVTFDFTGPHGKSTGDWGWLVDTNVFKENSNKERKEVAILGGEPIDNNDVIQGVFISPYTADLQAQNYKSITNLVQNKKIKKAVEYLSNINSEIEDLVPLTDESGQTIYADIGLDKLLPVNLLGAGFQNCLRILLPMMTTTKQEIMFIDEFENGIHHTLLSNVLEFVFKLALENETQLFITTHSREFIDAFIEVSKKLEIQDDVAFFRISKKGIKGDIPRYSLKETEILIEDHLDIR